MELTILEVQGVLDKAIEEMKINSVMGSGYKRAYIEALTYAKWIIAEAELRKKTHATP